MVTRKIIPFTLLTAVLLAGLYMPARPARAQSTFTVTNTADSGPGSLRQAILDANGSSGLDTIAFNIPTSDPGYGLRATGVWTIRPASPLPPVGYDGAVIDGTTQGANQGETNLYGPEVELHGVDIAGGYGVIYLESSNNTIRGLAINGEIVGSAAQPGAGIVIEVPYTGNTIADNYIGTDAMGLSAQPCGAGIVLYNGTSNNVIEGNVLAGNSYYGIDIFGSGTSGNQVRGNLIGLGPWSAAAIPNALEGVRISQGAQGNVVGGQSDHRNIISGNGQNGVYLSDATTTEVSYNYIGTGIDGNVDVGNSWNGVAIEGNSQTNFVNNNVIAGNNRHGVWLGGSGATGNYVSGNIIGADATASTGIANGWHGVAVYDGASGNAVLGNVIVASAWSGVAIIGSSSNTVHGNAIGANWSGASLGNGFHGVVTNGVGNIIEFNTIAYNGLATASNGVQIGDPTALNNTVTQNSIYSNGNKGIALVDGSNNNIAAPTIGGASCDDVSGMACVGCRVEVFSDSGDEGRTYEGTTWADDVSGVFWWGGAIHGPHVTVTATDSQGNTSEFSAPWSVGCYRVFLPAIIKH